MKKRHTEGEKESDTPKNEREKRDMDTVARMTDRQRERECHSQKVKDRREIQKTERQNDRHTKGERDQKREL